MKYKGEALIKAVHGRCKVCYTCVRECPAKAIKISHGQADVMGERCIGCGNCIKVCSQNAKEIVSSIDEVLSLLKENKKIAAILAPSFPAEFINIDYQQLCAGLRRLGFSYINEVGFGADLVAREYNQFLEKNADQSYISSSCPAVVAYIEKYHPQLVNSIIPVVSPMIATSRALKKIHGQDLKIVFIGPCLAKKGEMIRPDLIDEIDEVLTFSELQAILKNKNIDLNQLEPSDFDPPHAHTGNLFAISKGALQAANIEEDLLKENVISATGKEQFVEAIKEFSLGYLDASLLETLCCNGCIMGAGISNNSPLYKKRHLVREYVKSKNTEENEQKWKEVIKQFKDIDLKCHYFKNDQRIPMPENEEIIQILKKLGKNSLDDELNCGACGYETCREHASAILKGLAENEMCLPYVIDKLKTTVFDLEKSYSELKNVKEELNHREKLASMGQLAAGIAHEINNPLGIVLMYAHILLEQCESKDELKTDISMIVEQADRCKKIVSGLLNFARQNKVLREPINLEELVQRCINSLKLPGHIELEFKNLLEKPMLNIDKDQIMQVLLNVINNAVDSMENKGRLTIKLSGKENEITISICDTGVGIPEENKKRIFEPFFTTKQLGKGTGLGLPVSYGIIKMHYGRIDIESNPDPAKGPTGTKVHITLPKK